MANKLHFRQARPEDIKTLCDIALAMNAPEKNMQYFERCLVFQNKGERLLYIFEDSGAPCGYGILNWRPRYALYQKLDAPEVQDINVIHDYRRKGIATAFLNDCEIKVRQAGKKYIGISVGLHWGFAAAQSLYIRQGYVPDGQGVSYDRVPVTANQSYPVDDNLCLMLLKEL